MFPLTGSNIVVHLSALEAYAVGTNVYASTQTMYG